MNTKQLSTRICSALLLSATLFTFSGQAYPSGGGGGGGNSSNTPGTLLTFDSITSVEGTTPSCSGDYTITNPIPGYYTWTTFDVSVKSKPLNLPDGARLIVTLYAKDALTGNTLPPVRLGDMVVLKKVGLSKSSYAFMDLGILYGGAPTLRTMDKVVITTASGQVVGIGR
jgi:hypothetical protein